MKLDIGKLKPCETGLEWYSLQKSSIEAWSNCHRGDWMLWIAIELGVDKKKLILAGVKCANTVRHLMKDKRSRNAVDTLIAYGEGRATEEEFEKARSEAYAAYIAAYAAYAAAEVCNAADAASFAAFWAAYAAYAAAARDSSATHYASNAAYYAAWESQEAREAYQLQTANICREILTNDIIEILQK